MFLEDLEIFIEGIFFVIVTCMCVFGNSNMYVYMYTYMYTYIYVLHITS